MKETIIQFGSGNFLRGFAEYFIHILNEKGLYDGKIVIVQPTKGGKTEIINEQKGRYNLFLRGIEKGKEISMITKSILFLTVSLYRKIRHRGTGRAE